MARKGEIPTIKCVMLGDSSCGKSSASMRYTTGSIPQESYEPTIVECRLKRTVIDGELIKILIWNTGGQEEFKRIRLLIYNLTDVVVFAFNLANKESLENILSQWHPEVKEHLPNSPIVLIGMQLDKFKEETFRSTKATKTVCNVNRITEIKEQIKAVAYYQCSAFTDEGITKVFENIGRFGVQSQRSNFDRGKKPDESQAMFYRDIMSCKSDEETLDRFAFWKKCREKKNSFTIPEQKLTPQIEINTDGKRITMRPNFGQTIIHFLLERQYLNSIKYLLNEQEEEVVNMLNMIDLSNVYVQNIPEIVARENGLTDIAEKLVNLADLHNINTSQGIDYGGKMHDITIFKAFHYAEHNRGDLLLKLIMKSRLDKNPEHLFSLRDPFTQNTILMAVKEDAFAIGLLSKAPLSTLKLRNSNGENVAHSFGKKGLTKSIDLLIAMLKKTPDNEDFLVDLLQQEDSKGNTPLMSAAVHEQSSALARFLLIYYEKPDQSTLNYLLHHKNKDESTILYLVFQASRMMFGPYGILLELEQMVHMESGEDNHGFLELQRCLRRNHGSSTQTITTLDLLKNTMQRSTFKTILECLRIFFVVCFIRLVFYLFDVVTDSLLTASYFEDWKDVSNTTSMNGNHTTCNTNCNITSDDLLDYPPCFSSEKKFLYSIVFIILPWVFYAYESLTHEFSRSLHRKVSRFVDSFIQVSRFKFLNRDLRFFALKINPIYAGRTLFKFVLLCLLYPVCFLCWPLISIGMKCYHCVRYETSQGQLRIKYEDKVRASSQAEGRSLLLEACIEATFQPILQWYLILPSILMNYTNYLKGGEMPKCDISKLSYFSLASSMISLAWSFTAYKATYKRGALDPDVAPISRAVLFISDLLLILPRINCIVLFMYYFGPGQFYPGIIFLVIHFLCMIILHNCFSNDLKYFKEGKYLKYFHVCFLNGFGNMLSNNGEVAMTNLKHNTKGKTLVRHLTYDIVLLMENLVLGVHGYHLTVQQQSAKDLTLILSLISYLLGIILKMFYYKKLHVWSDLITVTQRKSNGDMIFKTEFNWLGKVRNIEIPIYPFCCNHK